MKLDLSFNGHDFNQIDANGQPCVTLVEVASVLYGKGEHQSDVFFDSGIRQLNTLYRHHADEFSESMSTLVKMQTAGGTQDVRVFSLRGCHLLAIFARTPMAKQFRRWALDEIEWREKMTEETLPMLYTALAEFAESNAIASLHGRGLYGSKVDEAPDK